MVIRTIANEIPNFEKLNLPPVLKDVVMNKASVGTLHSCALARGPGGPLSICGSPRLAAHPASRRVLPRRLGRRERQRAAALADSGAFHGAPVDALTRMNDMILAGPLEVNEPAVVPWVELPVAHQAMWDN